MGAIGAPSEILSPAEPGGLAVAVKSDAFWVRTSSAAVRGSAGNLEASETDVSHLRLLVESSTTFETGGVSLTPTLELGVRHDGGEAETGTGIEAGGELRCEGDGVTVEGSVRTLVAHEESGYKEWGAAGSIRVDPGTSGRGLSLTLRPSWGAAQSGTEQLRSLRDSGELGGDSEFEAESRLEGEIGYGLGLGHTPGVVTPFAGITLGDGRRVRTGARWQVSPDAALGVEAHPAAPATNASTASATVERNEDEDGKPSNRNRCDQQSFELEQDAHAGRDAEIHTETADTNVGVGLVAPLNVAHGRSNPRIETVGERL